MVSILAGMGVSGAFAVLAADGSPVIEGVALEHAVQAARFEAVRSWAGCHGINLRKVKPPCREPGSAEKPYAE